MKKIMQMADRRSLVLDSMKKEQKRAFSRLRLDDFEKPYFIGYTTKYRDNYSIRASYGAIDTKLRLNSGITYADVRVGSYESDQTSLNEKPWENLEDLVIDLPDNLVMPIEEDPEAIRIYLWRLTDRKYKEAIAKLYKKRGRIASEPAGKVKIPDFSREEKIIHTDPIPSFSVEAEYWEDVIRRLSRRFKNYSDITDSHVAFETGILTRYVTNTEGTEIITERPIYDLGIKAAAICEDGMPVEIIRCFYYRDACEMPGIEDLERESERLIEDILNLRNAPILEPYSGPALLEPMAAGIFFHEAIGHRLEGERQLLNDEGQTFKGKIGERILPDFISIVDDPTIESYEGKSLWGHYLFDDQGVPARRVVLVREGVLENYLMSRTPVEGITKSNGHGRNQLSIAQGGFVLFNQPRARMANFFIEAGEGKSYSELADMLMSEVERKKKSYGLIIRDAENGETNTSSFGFQAFKFSPRMVYRVDIHSGKMTLVRGIDFVGTPLSSIGRIIACGDKRKAQNGICGAESGFVSISTVSPSVLIGDLEFQKKNEKTKRLPILPIPLNMKGSKISRR